MWYKTLLALLLVCLMPALAASQAGYLVMDLGPLSPTGINTWDQVVGTYNNQAYVWTFGRMRPLGTLAGGTSSSAAAINDLGVVTGTADGSGTVISPDPSISNQECSDLTQPFVWTQKKGMQGLGTVGDDNNPTSFWCETPFYASGINFLDQVVGYTSIYEVTYQFGFLWSHTGGMTLFGGSWPPTIANGVSDSGEIVGESTTFELFSNNILGHATSWKNGIATDLGTLGGGANVLDYGSSANGVSSRGQVVGWSNTAPASDEYPGSPLFTMHAVLWTNSGRIRDLGTLPGDAFSVALKINFFGQVIGSSGDTVAGGGSPFVGSPITVIGRPFIWSRTKGMQDLNTLIPDRSGWVLNSVADINALGHIVGSGTHDGETHGFLLIPSVFGD